jgi:WS/DGAT/MGAT family acyltransferase
MGFAGSDDDQAGARRIGDFDAVLWDVVERDPLFRNTITVIFVLDGDVDRGAVADRLERMSRIVPGLRHRVVTPPLRLANPRYVLDPDFDLSYHVRWMAAPEPKTLDAVLEYAQASSASGLDRDRPLWAFTGVEGLQGNQTAVILEVHHALTDGVGGISMLPHLVDLDRDPGELAPMPPLPAEPVPTNRELALEALDVTGQRFRRFARESGRGVLQRSSQALRHPRDAAADAVRGLRSLGRLTKPSTASRSPIMVERSAWARFAVLEIELAPLRRAAKPRGFTVNDAFLAALGNGFARYHERLGSPVDELVASVPISTRRPGDATYGSHVSGGFLTIPVGTDDPATYMATYHDLIAVTREDVEHPLAGSLIVLLNGFAPLIPKAVSSMLKQCDFVASNVPGVDVPLYLGGAELLALYGLGPRMGTATNVTLVSYRGTAFVGLNIDAAAVPDPDLLAVCIREGFDAVAAL